MTEAEAKEVLGIVPDSSDVMKGAELRSFGKYVEQRIILKRTIENCEKEIKALNDQLTMILAKHDCERVIHGLHKVAIITKTTTKLDKEKLLHNGVPAGVIALSMVTSKSSYLEVREIREND